MSEYQSEESGEKDPHKKLLKEIRDGLKACIDDEDSERQKMLDDLRFCTLDQWPADIRKDRENDLENGPRPCLTIDKINQYIVQVVNDMRQGKPGINVRPQDDAADIETAKILKGLVRNIEDQSKADIAYATAGENAAKIGLGFLRVVTEYVSEDSFDQEIFIRPLANTFAVYLGRHVMPDGSDAKSGYIVESMPLARFREEFPRAKSDREQFEGLQDLVDYWHTGEVVTVVEYYCLERIDQTLYFLADGTTISKEDYDKWPESAGAKPSVQDRRAGYREQLKWAKVTGVEVLDERKLPGKYIPIIEVIGRESNVQGKRIIWGLVRPAKDSLRMYNYWASTITEKFGLAPKTPYIGAKGQFEGLEKQWKDANRVNRPYLEYNPVDVQGNALPRPERQGPTPMEAAYFQQMQVIEHDVQTSLGMFKAATGESESQQSGRAILALQKESDTGTYHFGANLGVSIRHVGRIIVDLIPHYYDTKRVVRILGEDGEVQTAQLDPEQDVAHQKVQTDSGVKSIYNPGVGKYDVSITVGPSYSTKRMEDQAIFVEMAKGAADPASAAILRYLVMRNSDTPGALEASKLLKSMLPPQALQALESKEPIPAQAQAQIQQLTQQVQAMQKAGDELHQENQKLKAGEAVAIKKVAVSAQEGQQKIEVDRQQAEKEMAIAQWKQGEEIRLAREKAAAEIALEREKAEAKISLERAIAEAEIGIERERLAIEKERAAQQAKQEKQTQQ